MTTALHTLIEQHSGRQAKSKIKKLETILIDNIYIIFYIFYLFVCTCVFHGNVFRSIGQVGRMEFDEIGQHA